MLRKTAFELSHNDVACSEGKKGIKGCQFIWHIVVNTPLMRFRHWTEPPAAQPLHAACRHRLTQRPA